MQFTDIFIRRPVLASVLSLVILLLGIRAGFDLTVREYPEIQNAQLSVTVPYPGADAELVAGFVTRPLEREIATADGIDFLSSSSQQGQATTIEGMAESNGRVSTYMKNLDAAECLERMTEQEV